MSGIAAWTKVFDSVEKGIRLWRDKSVNTQSESEKRFNAINAVLEAAISTKAYLYDTNVLQTENREKEIEIAHMWRMASNAIRNYDYELYRIAQLKAIGWADPREWNQVDINPNKIKLDLIIKQCRWLQENN